MARLLPHSGVIPCGHDPTVEERALVIQIANPQMPAGNKRHLDQMTALFGISDRDPKATGLLRALDSRTRRSPPPASATAAPSSCRTAVATNSTTPDPPPTPGIPNPATCSSATCTSTRSASGRGSSGEAEGELATSTRMPQAPGLSRKAVGHLLADRQSSTCPGCRLTGRLRCGTKRPFRLWSARHLRFTGRGRARI